MRGIIFFLLSALLSLCPVVGICAMDKQDLMVGMKVLPLLSNKITGNVKIAILYDPKQNASQQEAESIKSIIDGGLELPGEMNATAMTVPLDQPQKMAGSRIAIVTSNLKPDYAKISDTASSYNVLTISTDLDCVHENKCIIGIVSRPRIEIYYSRAAAENAKVNFEQAFTILAKPASLLAGDAR